MSDQPATGEWTAESVYALGIFTADFGVRMARIINAALAAEQRKHDRELADYARKQSNVLEAERLHNESTIVDIEQQLAAERGFHAECEKQLQACFDKLAAEMEKVQTLVDALKWMAEGHCVDMFHVKRNAEAALAKVKEGK